MKTSNLLSHVNTKIKIIEINLKIIKYIFRLHTI